MAERDTCWTNKSSDVGAVMCIKNNNYPFAIVCLFIMNYILFNYNFMSLSRCFKK